MLKYYFSSFYGRLVTRLDSPGTETNWQTHVLKGFHHVNKKSHDAPVLWIPFTETMVMSETFFDIFRTGRQAGKSTTLPW